jgi:aspartate 1-decarboxylase
MRLVKLLKSKIHHARVTYANAEYVGSIEICPDVMDAVGLLDGEYVHVWNVENGKRLTTYAFRGERACIGLNGAAAFYAEPGDRLIIAAFTWTDERVHPQIVLLDENNQIVRELTPFARHG